MSKDKGTKNVKKAPADKSASKSVSSYKSEGKIKAKGIDTFTPKPMVPADKGGKK
ncbi:MAG: hypothetical protein K9I85_13010 [Saprospiraceae bacterium]|nr:hypothetical protein [Saprospiraceae bacterium]